MDLQEAAVAAVATVVAAAAAAAVVVVLLLIMKRAELIYVTSSPASQLRRATSCAVALPRPSLGYNVFLFCPKTSAQRTDALHNVTTPTATTTITHTYRGAGMVHHASDGKQASRI